MKKLFFIFFLPSFFIMLLATSVDPILRYEFARPLSQFLLPSFLRGELAINQYGIFNNQFITKDSVAFNVGQLMGLGGTFSLLPLFGIWLAGLWCLSSKLKSQHLLSRKNQYGLLAGTGLFIMGLVFFPLLYQVHESKFVIAGKGTGLIGYYYAGAKWEGNPVFIRKDAKIYFQWEGKKAPPLPAPFSVEWKGKLIIPRGGIYTFYSESDDGSWIYIDGRVVVDNSGRHAPILKSGNIRLAKGEHQLLIKYVNLEHSAVMKLLWKPPGKIQEVIPTRYLLQR